MTTYLIIFLLSANVLFLMDIHSKLQKSLREKSKRKKAIDEMFARLQKEIDTRYDNLESLIKSQ